MTFEEILNTNKEDYGKTLSFKKGYVIVWNGLHPAILKVSDDIEVEVILPFNKNYTDCVSSTYSNWDSLQYEWLRLATKDEIKLIGEKDIYKLYIDEE